MGNNTDVNFVSVYPTSLIVPAGGRAAATVVFAPTAGARAGYYWGSVNASAAGVALAVPLAYYVRASLALVDDDLSDRAGTRAMFDNFATYPSSSSNISKTLDRFGVEHDILTTAHFDNNGPNELELKNYAIVIWDTGYDWGFSDTTHTHYTLSARDQKSLAAYLDAGGQLWLIGESIAWNIYNGTNQSVPAGDFLNAYMGVSRVDHNLNTPGVVKGSSATFMAGVNYTAIPDWTGYANNGDFATNLTPSAAGFTILHNYTQDIYGKTYADASVAVAVNSSSFRTVFWGFEFSWLRTQAAFDDAVNRTLGFFNRSKTLALPTNDLALELVVDPYASDWFPILDSAWGRPFDNLALPFATLNATVTLRNLGSSPQQNVTVNVSLRDNTTAPQQTVQLVFADVPALSTSVQRAQLVPLKHGYFTVNASLGAADSNATNNAAGSSVLVPNYEDDLSSGAGWNASGAWKITTAWSWSSPASWSTGTKNNANDTLVSPLLNLSAVNASSISGGARLYFRMSGVVGGGDAVLVETRNASSAVWVTQLNISSLNQPSTWNYYTLGNGLPNIANDTGYFRMRFVTGAASSSYFYADHFLVWTYHERGQGLDPTISLTNATRAEGQLVNYAGQADRTEGLLDLAFADVSPLEDRFADAEYRLQLARTMLRRPSSTQTTSASASTVHSHSCFARAMAERSAGLCCSF